MDQSSNVVPPKNKPHDGPMRETAVGLLKRKIVALRREADGYEALLKLAYQMEVGSPAEERLWEMLVGYAARNAR